MSLPTDTRVTHLLMIEGIFRRSGSGGGCEELRKRKKKKNKSKEKFPLSTPIKEKKNKRKDNFLKKQKYIF